jgi:hypothetical protein
MQWIPESLASVKSTRVILLLLLMLWLTIGCVSQKVPDGEKLEAHRNHYDTLNLHTPQAAVETFINAYQRFDFPTVHMILAPAAQQKLLDHRSMLIWDGVNSLASSKEYPEEFSQAFIKRVEIREHIFDGIGEFDALMMTAAERNGLKIHLPGKVTIISANNSRTLLDQEAVDVNVEVEGISQTVTFRMVQSPGGQWRVFQIIFPGGDETNYPWSVASTGTATRPDDRVQLGSHKARTYYESLDLTTPQTAVSTFVAAFQQEDFPTVFLILHREAQVAWMSHFLGRDYQNLVNMSEPAQILAATNFGQRLQMFVESGIISQNEASLALFHLSLSGPYQGFPEPQMQSIPHIYLVMEHIGDFSYLFDEIMLAANEQYLVDLRGHVTIVETRLRKLTDGAMMATVTTALEGVEGEVVFRLKQSPMGRWRVLQVIVPGGDESLYPWAAPRNQE